MAFTFTINGHEYTSDPANATAQEGYKFIGYGYITALANLAVDIAAVAATTVSSAATSLSAPGTSATSTTSDTIALGSTTIVIQAGKSIVVGMSMKIASTASPTNWMHGDVTAYDSGTGSLTVNVTGTSGSGTFAAWTVSISAPGAGDVTLTGVQTLSSKTYTAPKYTRDDDGSIAGGTWAIDYANGPVIKATAGANITSITMANWPASGTEGHLSLRCVNFGAHTITFPAWNWIKSDLTTTTTFSDLSLTLPSSGTAFIDLRSDDGGTTITATVRRN